MGTQNFNSASVRLTSAALLGALGLTAALAGCTAAPSAFKLAQRTELFDAQIDINTTIDLLWVVDNSSSMDTSQKKLRDGLTGFATKYMQPTWDIKVAIITTDTYLANSGYSAYLTAQRATGTSSAYLAGRGTSFPGVNGAGVFTLGWSFADLYPAYASNYARLTAGRHDGPMSGLCFEGAPYFYAGASNCRVRDAVAANTGRANCLTPQGIEKSEEQCTNTRENDSVHSGKPIISTLPGAGVTADATYIQGLFNDFITNVSVGVNGSGSERGLQSVLQLLTDNEGTSTKLFRQNSLRGIIFISDEEDQSMAMPSPGASPYDNYACDQAGLLARNPTVPARITGANGYCCTGAGCFLGANGTSCPLKTVGTLSYRTGVCALTASLLPVATVKTQLDTFFNTLDQGVSPNYFVATITPLTDTSLQTVQNARDVEDNTVANFSSGVVRSWSADRAQRYIDLGTAVGNGSLALELNSPDYSAVLDAIGQEIVTKKSTFTLGRSVDPTEDLILYVVHSDGTTTSIASTQFTVVGRTVTITDANVVLAFRSGDKLGVKYFPKSLS